MNLHQAAGHFAHALNHARRAGESLIPPETRRELALFKYELRSAIVDLIDPGERPTNDPDPTGDADQAGDSAPKAGTRRINIEED